MKELTERHQYVDYMAGKQMPAREFTHGALDIFGEYVFEDVIREHCGRQKSFPIEGFEGDIYYTKSRPIKVKSPEQEFLSRPTELKNGTTRLI